MGGHGARGLTRTALAGSRTGVFVGMTHGDYTMVAADANALDGPYGFLGNSFSMASGRVAYALGVHGPALTVDTACSSGSCRGAYGVPQFARGRKRSGVGGRRVVAAGTA